MTKPTEEEEDLLDELEEASPLNVLDADDVAKATAKQRRFLMNYIMNPSIPQSRRASDVTLALWKTWQKDDHFMKLFGIVKDPIRFAFSLRQAVVHRAMLEHFQLLASDKVIVKQWAIEHAYKLIPPSSNDRPEGDNPRLGDIKLIAEQIAEHLPEETRQLATRKEPFAVVDAEVREVPDNIATNV